MPPFVPSYVPYTKWKPYRIGNANISNNNDFVVGNIHKYPKPNVQFVFHVYTDRADVSLLLV